MKKVNKNYEIIDVSFGQSSYEFTAKVWSHVNENEYQYHGEYFVECFNNTCNVALVSDINNPDLEQEIIDHIEALGDHTHWYEDYIGAAADAAYDAMSGK